MKKYPLWLATLLIMSGAAHAVGTITGLSSTPANPIAGEAVKYKITTSGTGACGMRLIYAGANYEPSDNMLINNQPAGGGVMDKTIAKAGTYNLKAIGSPSLNPKCNGEASLTIVVKDKPAAAAGKPAAGQGAAATPQAPAIMTGSMTLSAATICPSPYNKYTQGADASKGESYCVKTNVACPEGFTGTMNDQTGKLVCTPKIAAQCPEGWNGGAIDGKLICNSNPQPHVSCPTAPGWKWGTTYYTASWNKMGCSANTEPPK